MSFDSDLRKAQKELENKVAKIIKVHSINVFNEIIIGETVDTGRLRGNWQATINTPATGTLFEDVDKDKKITRTDNVPAKVSSYKLSDTLYLTNNLPYAEAIENGSSTKRPAKRVANIIKRSQEFLNKAVAKAGK